MQNKAVILGSNYFIALSILRSLGPHDVHCVALDHSKKNSYAFLSRYVKEAHVTPHYKDQEAEFLVWLIDYAKKQEVKPVLFPCADNYVEFIDKHLDELREVYLIPQTQKGLYTEVMNKDTLHDLAVKYGVRVPESYRSNENDLFTKVIENVGYPCIVKPVDSPAFTKAFRVKSFMVHDESELEAALNKAHSAELEVIVQRIIPGFDDHMYTYDAYMNQASDVTHWVTCNKFRQYPINFGASSFTIQKYVPELHVIGEPFFKAMGYKGFAEIEFKKDAKTGEYYLIEINVRTTTLNSMLQKAGVNFPYVQYCELTGKPLPNHAVKEDTNIAFWFEYEDMLAIKDYIKTNQLTLKQVFPTFKRPIVPAVFDAKDVKPFFGMLGMLGGRAVRKVKRMVFHA